MTRFSDKSLENVVVHDWSSNLLGNGDPGLDCDGSKRKEGADDVHHDFSVGGLSLLASDLCAQSRGVRSGEVLFKVVDDIASGVVHLFFGHSVEVSHVVVMLLSKFADLVPEALNLGFVHSLDEVVVADFLLDPVVDSVGVKVEFEGHWLSGDFIDDVVKLALNYGGLFGQVELVKTELLYESWSAWVEVIEHELLDLWEHFDEGSSSNGGAVGDESDDS